MYYYHDVLTHDKNLYIDLYMYNTPSLFTHPGCWKQLDILAYPMHALSRTDELYLQSMHYDR